MALAESMHISDILTPHRPDRWHRPAVVHGDSTLTYGDLADRSGRVARWLQKGGYRGKKVALLLPNGPEFLAAYLGAAGAGCVVVPINSALKPPEIRYILEDARAGLLLTCREYYPRVAPIRGQLPSLRAVVATDAVVEPGATRLSDIISAQPPGPYRVAGLKETDPLAIMYTSGTTGFPKGVVLTHHNLMSTVISCREVYGTTADDVFICMLPMWHVYPITDCVLLPLWLGTTIVSTNEDDPAAILELVTRHRVTVLAGMAPLFIALANLDRPCDLRALKLCMSAGAPLPLEVFRRFRERYGAPITEGYGLTECAATVTMMPVGGNPRAGSVGLPIPGVEVALVDDGGRPVAWGAVGELVVRGPTVMQCYYNNDEATRETIRDGWLYTGDLATQDADGYYYIVDRKKNMITVNGVHVYPREVEMAAYGLEQIAEACVVEAPDAAGHSHVTMVASLRSPIAAEAVRAYLAEQIADYKVPSRIIFVDELPQTGSGKLARNAVRDLVIQRCNR